jgi:hypothetical protein
LALVERFGSAQALLALDAETLRLRLRRRGILMRRATVERALAWAREAPPPDPAWKLHHGVLCDYLHLIRHLDKEIERYEVRLLHYLTRAPALVLLSIPGLNVASVCGYASELGPIENYIGPKQITGRAGLFPCRYQSAETDHAGGPLARGHNTRLRDGILEAARCLLQCNPYFKTWRDRPRQKDWTEARLQVAVGNRFVRISNMMLRGKMVFAHPCTQRRDSILAKILNFACDHRLAATTTERLLREAIEQLPADSLLYEVKAMEEATRHQRRGRALPARAVVPGSPELQAVIQHLWARLHQNQGDQTTKNPT